MANQPRIAVSAVRTLSGMSIPKEMFLEAASQTFKKGAFCVLNASGHLAECGADPPLIMGVATRDGQNGSAGVKEQVLELCHPDTLFVGNFDNGSGTQAGAQSNIGKMYGVAKHSSSGKWYIDSTDQTNKRVIIWKFWGQDLDVITDNLCRFLFSFDPAYFQGHKTS